MALAGGVVGDSPGDHPLGVDPDDVECLGMAADLDSADVPGVDAGQVVDDYGRAAGTPYVAVFLRAVQLGAADVDAVLGGVVGEAGGGHVRCAVHTDRGDPGEAGLGEEGEFGLGEDSHVRVLSSVPVRCAGKAIRPTAAVSTKRAAPRVNPAA